MKGALLSRFSEILLNNSQFLTTIRHFPINSRGKLTEICGALITDSRTSTRIGKVQDNISESQCAISEIAVISLEIQDTIWRISLITR